ncbi:MAG: hypothetical protein AAFQ57_02615 [Cyanobacteria bacterium J06626_14]
MSAIQRVRCPNCGDFAERQVLSNRQASGCDRVVQTACEACDYLMVMGFPAGKVLEAYAPGQVSSAQCDSNAEISRWVRPSSMSTHLEGTVQSLSRLFSHIS